MVIFYLIFISLIYIRFFTETLNILPRSLQFLDILFVLLIFIFVSTKKESLKYSYIIIIFSALVLFNSSIIRIDISFLSLLFIVGPFVVYIFFKEKFSMLDEKSKGKILNWFVLAYYTQIIIGVLQIPFALTVSPDALSGSFGVNNTQMQIFILGGSVYFFAIYLQKNLKKYLILSIVLVLLFFFGGWRAMFIAPVVIFSIVLLTFKKASKIIFILPIFLFFFAFGFFIYITYIDTFIDEYKYKNYIENIFMSAKFRSFGNVFNIYADNPETIVLGTGPGTYGSRAFQTFSERRGLRDKKTDAVSAAFNVQPYTNYYEQKYLYSFDASTFSFGSETSDSPFNSYASFLAEYGLIFGGLIIFSIFKIIKRVFNLMIKYKNTYLYPIYANVLAALIATAFASLLNDYWGIFRVTVPISILLAYADSQSEKYIIKNG